MNSKLFESSSNFHRVNLEMHLKFSWASKISPLQSNCACRRRSIMLLTCLFLMIAISNQISNIEALSKNRSHKCIVKLFFFTRKKKLTTKIHKLFIAVLNLFQIVKFPNGPCNATSTTQGVCYTSDECNSKGGVNSGTCANGFGVCCVCKTVLFYFYN